MARRKPRLPKRERKTRKAAYDAIYRAQNQDALREKKREYHECTYDPVVARRLRRAKRAESRAYFAAYRQKPEWKRHKRTYDRKRRDAVYGEFAAAARVLRQLQKENARTRWYDRAKDRGYYENQRTTQERKRSAQISRW